MQITHLGFLFVMFSFQIHQKTLFISDLALHIHEDSDDKVEQLQWLHNINQPHYFSVNIQETNCLFNTWIPVRHVAQTTTLLRSRYFPDFSPFISLYYHTSRTFIAVNQNIPCEKTEGSENSVARSAQSWLS